jgi:hypothetical protein
MFLIDILLPLQDKRRAPFPVEFYDREPVLAGH